MSNHFAANYGRAFAEILFLRPKSDSMRKLNLFSKISLYFLAVTLFYAPIFYFIVKSSIANPELILYYLAIIAFHVFSKIMLHSSKRIQKRFSTIKNKKAFFFAFGLYWNILCLCGWCICFTP